MKWYHPPLAEAHQKAHVGVVDAQGKTYEFPVVRGVVAIPDALTDRAALGAPWEPFTGQVPVPPDDQLKPFKNAREVDAFYNSKGEDA